MRAQLQASIRFRVSLIKTHLNRYSDIQYVLNISN